jgi:hypothetical protein
LDSRRLQHRNPSLHAANRVRLQARTPAAGLAVQLKAMAGSIGQVWQLYWLTSIRQYGLRFNVS